MVNFTQKMKCLHRELVIALYAVVRTVDSLAILAIAKKLRVIVFGEM